MEKIMTEFELQCYGMSKEQIRKEYMESLTARLSGQEMVVMGILSDCQEMLEMGYSDNQIRQQLNVAKFILSKMMEKREEAAA
jgi:calcineurin-like phosphoesterase family protein